MTTAARPTFDTAKGTGSDLGARAPSLQYSAKDQPGYTKLKFRQPGQSSEEEIKAKNLKESLLVNERKKKSEEVSLLITEKQETLDQLKELAKDIQQPDMVDEDMDDASSDSISEHASLETEEEDETAELMKELEKIKAEREMERQRQEALKKAQEVSDYKEELLASNPLLNPQSLDFRVKRRWDEDVVFKNQATKIDEKPKKRFTNDMVRSDFHREFMKKFIK